MSRRARDKRTSRENPFPKTTCTATCIIIAPTRLKLRLSGSARDFSSRSAEKRGDQSRFKCRKGLSIIMQFAVSIISSELRRRYSYSTDVLGRCLELLSGVRLDVLLQQHLFRPLKMVDTVRNTPLCAPFLDTMHLFTKTGSGQT